MDKWKILQQEDIVKNDWYHLRKDVVELPDGQIVDDYFVSVRPEVVLVFGVTEDQKVLLVTQYKHGLQRVVTELPGGFLDKHTEKPIDTAKRELLEETGFSSDEFEFLGVLSDNPTKDTNMIYMFLAKNCRKVSDQNLDVTENILVSEIEINKIKEMVLKQDIYISGSVATIFLALENLQK